LLISAITKEFDRAAVACGIDQLLPRGLQPPVKARQLEHQPLRLPHLAKRRSGMYPQLLDPEPADQACALRFPPLREQLLLAAEPVFQSRAVLLKLSHHALPALLETPAGPEKRIQLEDES
jgi:hypothetical protein